MWTSVLRDAARPAAVEDGAGIDSRLLSMRVVPENFGASVLSNHGFTRQGR